MTLRTLLSSLGLASLLSAFVLAAPAAAQTTPPVVPGTPVATEAPVTPAPAETPPVPVTPNETDKSFPIAEAEKPREVLKGKFDDWELRCAASDETRCFIYQLAKDAEGRPVAEFTMIRLPDGGQAAAGATIVTALGVLIPKGIALVIDTGQPLAYPYLYCAPSGCFSRLGFTAATVTRMKKGAVAKLTLFGAAAPDKAVVGLVSLKGFTAAFAALPALKQP